MCNATVEIVETTNVAMCAAWSSLHAACSGNPVPHLLLLQFELDTRAVNTNSNAVCLDLADWEQKRRV